jgi:excisionase family DNA binding protein
VKVELTLSDNDVARIADQVIEKLTIWQDLNNRTPVDDFLSLKEASKLLGVPEGTIYQWVSSAKHGLKNFPYMKSGKHLRFSRNELIDWMKSEKNR